MSYFCPSAGRFPNFRGAGIAAIAVATTAVTLILMQVQPSDGDAGSAYQTPEFAVILHLATVLPALLLGGFLLARRKGGRMHRSLGRMWMAMMVLTAIASFWIRGPSGGFSGIHLFSVGTLIAVPVALWRIRAGDVKAHSQIMTSLYIGLIVAGAFALDPDRIAGSFVARLFG